MIADIVTMAGKDWRLFWADRRGAILGFLVPIILASAFGIIFDRSRESSALRLPMLIVAESDSRFIQEIVNDLRESSRAEITVTDRLTAERRIADRRPGVAVVLPDSLARLTAAADSISCTIHSAGPKPPGRKQSSRKRS
jgi:ABC-2 type transport system permease protein